MSILKKLFGEKKKPIIQNKPIEEVASAVKVKVNTPPADTSTFINRNIPTFNTSKKEEQMNTGSFDTGRPHREQFPYGGQSNKLMMSGTTTGYVDTSFTHHTIDDQRRKRNEDVKKHQELTKQKKQDLINQRYNKKI